MAQRHVHDDTIRLPAGHADPKSPMFVPIQLREAYSDIDDATELDLKRELWSGGYSGPMVRSNGGGKPFLADPREDADFEVCLHWLRLDEAARRLARDNERRTSHEQNQRTHTCKLCGRYDPTASTGTVALADRWCQPCRDELARQDVAEHAGRQVNGKTVADLIAAHRAKATT